MTTTDDAPAGRTYGQLCPLACALDVLGERWTLLVVRELLLGPKRFNELAARLSGIGPNRLSARLKRLRVAGVADKTADGAHALTAYGEGLREPVLRLGTWGISLLPPIDSGVARADLVALVLSGVVPPDRIRKIDIVVEVRSDEIFTLTVHEGAITVRSGASENPSAARLTCAPEVFVGLVLGHVDLAAATESGEVTVERAGPDLDLLITAFVTTTNDHLPAP